MKGRPPVLWWVVGLLFETAAIALMVLYPAFWFYGMLAVVVVIAAFGVMDWARADIALSTPILVTPTTYSGQILAYMDDAWGNFAYSSDSASPRCAYCQTKGPFVNGRCRSCGAPEP